ncbi:hypothetical protein ACIBQX_11715 [Nonomuraea sp. NPDC049714]|uniref:hypothetical protein n=1 Tax=Nonomuraea sp. NPDC049714 TaxID=3364357 RepID=UPI0037BAAEF9
MAQPYTTIADAQQMRTLTENGITRLRKLNDRDQQELELLRAERVRLMAEVGSVDEEMTDLHETIGRRQAKMRGDVIGGASVTPRGEPYPASWDGFASPEGSFTAVPDLAPDPDANLERLGELHDHQDAREGVSR